MKESPYDKNDTMKLIGHQNILPIFTDEATKQMDDVAKARPYSFSYSGAIDMFILGYINGKRAERARRKK